MRIFIRHLMTLFLCFILSSCIAQQSRPVGGSQSSGSGQTTKIPEDFGKPEREPGSLYETSEDSEQVGQQSILEAQASQAKRVPVLFSARVRKLLKDDTRGLPHQRFLLELENGSTVKVAHDTKYAPRVPLDVGDSITVKGEYIWNEKGGVVHWTHRSNSNRHQGGYIEFKGQKYE